MQCRAGHHAWRETAEETPEGLRVMLVCGRCGYATSAIMPKRVIPTEVRR